MKTAKRLTALLAALVLLLALTACAAPQPDAPQESAPPASAAQSGTVELPPSDAPLPSSPTGSTEIEITPDAPAPLPPEAPAPEEPDALVCTLSISCAVLLDHMDELDAEKAELIPADGILLPAAEHPFTEGESVFDLLLRVCRENKLHMEFSSAPLYGSAYIEGIGNLYEFDCGDGSGWMYRVNGSFPRFGCSQYVLCAGDTVEWLYTCDFGADIGGGEVSG